ncbi:hypothetical protein Nepgr_012639 [Nepenthes gracilis]|uniref:Uncharacterized protein n=1 Tax=Nepenthes gracilis TaxID=150966 RepID=A0AAD3XN98_NEPGR|nr:hypothetical protein Nepgr_012639 [Nepenthes gracilis]
MRLCGYVGSSKELKIEEIHYRRREQAGQQREKKTDGDPGIQVLPNVCPKAVVTYSSFRQARDRLHYLSRVALEFPSLIAGWTPKQILRN